MLNNNNERSPPPTGNNNHDLNLNFAPDFIRPICRGEKVCTLRLWGEEDSLSDTDKMEVGDLVVATCTQTTATTNGDTVTLESGKEGTSSSSSSSSTSSSPSPTVPFAHLTITSKDYVTFRNLTDEIAESEACTGVPELQCVLRRFYPSIGNGSRLVAVRFVCARVLEM